METMGGYLFVALITVVSMLPLSWGAQVLRSRPERPSLAPSLPSPERPRLHVVVPREDLPCAEHWQQPGQVRGKAETHAHYLYKNGAAE